VEVDVDVEEEEEDDHNYARQTLALESRRTWRRAEGRGDQKDVESRRTCRAGEGGGAARTLQMTRTGTTGKGATGTARAIETTSKGQTTDRDDSNNVICRGWLRR
jgi:hypothetical protein